MTTTPGQGPEVGQGCLIAFSGAVLAFGGCTIMENTDFFTLGSAIAWIGIGIVPLGLLFALVIALRGRTQEANADADPDAPFDDARPPASADPGKEP
jgi:hypothetical protein